MKWRPGYGRVGVAHRYIAVAIVIFVVVGVLGVEEMVDRRR